jgi:hypothetical protein
MRPVALTLLILMMLVTAGCGAEVVVVASTGNATIVVTTVSAPSIALAQFFQDTTTRTVLGSIDFTTSGSDLGTRTITVTDSAGAVVYRTVDDLAAYSGLISGSIPFSINYASFLPDTYAVTIFVTNRAGDLSNPVYGSFRVL